MKEVVDLGLPSGTLWAKDNFGIDKSETSFTKRYRGEYYAWGELMTKAIYSEYTYKFIKYVGDHYDLTKYDYVDSLTTL